MPLSFREYYDLVLRETNNIRARHHAGETIPVYDVELLINHINHILERLPVGTSQEDVPENAYNQLVDIRDILQDRLDSNDEQSAGRKIYTRKSRSKSKVKKMKRKKTHKHKNKNKNKNKK
jgi:hypothetical protein